jgi:murein L,D-transpeptidase YafK
MVMQIRQLYYRCMLRVTIIAALLWVFAVEANAGELRPIYLLQTPESTSHVFIAETESSTLYRIVDSPNGALIDERYMSVGQNGVGKRRAWDRRTPLGVYFVSERLDTSGLHEKYGPLAFPLDYPNSWDDLNERSGDGIWIHGVGPSAGIRPPQDTDGCISVPNNELLKLENDFVPLITPVIITRRIEWASTDEIIALRDELRAALDFWAGSFRSGDMHQHLSLYADDFEYRGLSKDEWMAYRLQTTGRRSIKDMQLSEILLISDPEETDIFLSRFRQIIVDDTQSIETTKRLYWRRQENGQFRIVAEEDG